MFQVSDPFAGRGKDITAREILDRGSQRITTELREQPEVRARLMDTMGTVYRSLGLYDKATELVQQALDMRLGLYGRDSLQAAASLDTLGVLKMDKGDYAASEPLRQALTIKLMRFDENHWEIATTKSLLGACLTDEGKYKEAEPLLVESYAIIKKEFGTQHDRTQKAGGRLVTLYQRWEKNDRAAQIKAELGSAK